MKRRQRSERRKKSIVIKKGRKVKFHTKKKKTAQAMIVSIKKILKYFWVFSKIIRMYEKKKEKRQFDCDNSKPKNSRVK